MLCISALRRTRLRSVSSSNSLASFAKTHLRPVLRHSTICARLNTTTAAKGVASAKPQAPPAKSLYPEKLCIYHPGTGRTTFLACVKLSTLFIFAFFGFVVTPNFYEKEGWSPTTIQTALSGIVPLVFVARTTSPFVASIHIRLPHFARQSKEMLQQYLRKMPPLTEVEIQTMSPIAKPRMTKVMLSELRPTSERFGIVNYARDTTAENAARKWYQFRAVGKFNIQGNKMPKVAWAWDEVAANIAKRQS